MIGGMDIVIPAVGDSAALDACVRILRRQWPGARFENAETGDKYASYEQIPLDQLSQLLVYPDAESEALWDADSPDSPPNSMIYLLAAPDCITVVLDDPETLAMQATLKALRTMLWTDILSTYARAA